MKWLLLSILLFATVLHSEFLTGQDVAIKPDTIFVNGDIYTQATPSRVQAIAVGGGKSWRSVPTKKSSS